LPPFGLKATSARTSRDFIGAIGENVDEFVEWVMRHDTLQVPDLPTDITDDLVAFRRRNLVLL
jgi:hypothetical protein